MKMRILLETIAPLFCTLYKLFRVYMSLGNGITMSTISYFLCLKWHTLSFYNLILYRIGETLDSGPGLDLTWYPFVLWTVIIS